MSLLSIGDVDTSVFDFLIGFSVKDHGTCHLIQFPLMKLTDPNVTNLDS